MIYHLLFFFLLSAPHVGVIGPITVDVLVWLLVNIPPTVNSTVGWLWCRSGDLQLAPRI